MEKFSLPDNTLSALGEKTKLKLPKIELVKFSGEIKDWLSFWSQFRRIHDDEYMNDEDKFQYLIQCMDSGGRAKEIVDSYPPSAENYSKVIESLRARFGRDELLVEYYVRELLTLVVKNAMHTKVKMSIMQLYDKLESYLRSLESIGVTKEKYAAMLFPLVESCIPEELLRVWLRNPVILSKEDKGDSYDGKLSQLLSFLRAEVEGEERISLARTGFKQHDSSQRKKDKGYEISAPVSTANDLFSGNRKKENSGNCLFCLKGHEAKECFQAQNMSYEEKKEKIKQKKACFACLQIGHTSKMCRTYVRCLICSRRHWVVMCPTLTTVNKGKDAQRVEEIQSTSMTSNNCSGEVFLQTLLVTLENNGKTRIVRAVVDTGAQQSYILESTAKEMGYKSNSSTDLTHVLFGGTTTEKKSHKSYQIKVSDMKRNFSCTLRVLDNSDICGKLPRLKRGPWEKELRQKNIWISDYGEGEPKIELLIGSDVCGTLLTGNIQKLENGLVAVETLLGWTVMGKINDQTSRRDDLSSSLSSMITSMLVHTDDVHNLWNLEVLGITDFKEKKTDAELEEAVWDHFHKTLKKTENRYEVSLPWINERENLPSNREIAEKRLNSTTKKLVLKDKFEVYNDVFKEWLTCGIIEEVPETEQDVNSHYLPHRPIFKENSTTSTRPVFDASCKSKDCLSLNDCLAKGQNLLELIPGLLLDFRRGKIGIISDIKKAFLQISIQKDDREFLKFLWWKDSDQKALREFRHCRVVFGLKCSPFLLGAVINSHLDQCAPPLKKIAAKLKTSFYVDNCVTSVDSNEEAEEFITNSTQLMASGGFELRGWQKTERNNEETSLNQPLKVLGLIWDKVEDSLFCEIPNVNTADLLMTRRSMLSITQQVFDPIGFCSPVTLLPKLYLQKSWETKLSWDAELPEDIKGKFLKWLKELHLLSSVKIPRQAILTDGQYFSLHTFSDASQGSYATVVYLRSQKEDEVEVSLLQAKARVAPLKKTTIPRLELLACLIGARLTSFVKKNLKIKISKEYYWTDSSTALFWIKNMEAWGTFVTNRVSEIRILTGRENWYHIPGSQNPADLPSRGCSVKKLIDSRWWEGPQWLKEREELWPHADVTEKEEEISLECKKTVMVTNIQQELPWYSHRFSSYMKIVKIIAWIKRFTNNSKSSAPTRTTSDLSVLEIQKAEIILLRLIQRDTFGSIKADALKTLNPILDEDGLIRTVTRLVNRQDTNLFKSPIILPSKHPVVKLLILTEHRNMSHAGVQTLMTHLRERYWILQCRRTVRQALRDCMNCRRFTTSRTEVVPAPLPENRVRDTSVFHITGVDLGGPLYLRTGEKTWFVLFTCAVFRAVHVELVLSLSTDSFLLAFRRFIARRGRPKMVYSDNGTNFVGANNALQEINWERIKEVSLTQRIQWIFIPPTAAWWGGWWERLVGMIKNIIRRVLGKARLKQDELTTVLCEAESIVNLRPLTYLSEDVEDLQPLTPSLFLYGEGDSSIPDLEEIDSKSLNKRYQYRQKLKENLRKRFRTEYLGQLRSYSWKKCATPLQIGQIVLVGSDNSKRLLWPLAKVLELYPGKDHNIRVARLKTAHGEILRPIQRLYPMEMNTESLGCQSEDVPTPGGVTPATSLKEVPSKDAESSLKKTRLGRIIKVPARFQNFELNY